MRSWDRVIALAARQLPERQRDGFKREIRRVIEGSEPHGPDTQVADGLLDVWRTILFPDQLEQLDRGATELLERGLAHCLERRGSQRHLTAVEYSAAIQQGGPAAEELLLYAAEGCPCRRS